MRHFIFVEQKSRSAAVAPILLLFIIGKHEPISVQTFCDTHMDMYCECKTCNIYAGVLFPTSSIIHAVLLEQLAQQVQQVQVNSLLQSASSRSPIVALI
jgi:hypothetical protein